MVQLTIGITGMWMWNPVVESLLGARAFVALCGSGGWPYWDRRRAPRVAQRAGLASQAAPRRGNILSGFKMGIMYGFEEWAVCLSGMLDFLNIETEMSSLWRLFLWLVAPEWQLPVQSVTTISSRFQNLRFNAMLSKSFTGLIQYKVSSYQYRKFHCGDKTVARSSYLHNGIFCSGKMASLFWLGPQIASGHARLDSIGRVRSYNNRQQVCYGRFVNVTSLRPCLACDLARLWTHREKNIDQVHDIIISNP